MNGGKKLILPSLLPVYEFSVNMPYRGKTYYRVHNDGKGHITPFFNHANAMELIKDAMNYRLEQASDIAETGEETIYGVHAFTYIAHKKTADTQHDIPPSHYAVNDNGQVYFLNTQNKGTWILFEEK